MRATLPKQQQKLKAMEKRMTRGGEVGTEGERKAHIDTGGRLQY